MDGRYIISERLVLNCRYPGGEMHVVNEVMVRGTATSLPLRMYLSTEQRFAR